MRSLLFSVLLIIIVSLANNVSGATFTQLTNEQLNQYELIAGKARNFYWQGRNA